MCLYVLLMFHHTGFSNPGLVENDRLIQGDYNSWKSWKSGILLMLLENLIVS